ncbi:MAG: hypothetical protein A2Y40_04610 [Candidatus Margulisbacteria bacterium GWF2_35_9]|nr:MAG: hypothetical protein A2Y40_04610 [Candidatus Margulisbacteria bacterium GWF2_35_9]
MKNSKTFILKTIHDRKSVRSYDNEPINPKILDELIQYTKDHSTGPFGNTTTFKIVDAQEFDPTSLKALGTYGIIRGAKQFLVGIIAPGKMAMEDFGYSMEEAILKATSLGLGTCWLGGFLNRSTFSDLCKISDNEVIPSVTPIGYLAKRTTLRDKMIRKAVNANNRTAFDLLFFSDDFTTPLNFDESNLFHQLLECVRIGPSASNKQPWRMVLSSKTLHLYLDEDLPYNHKYEPIFIQNIDMGIAMAHVSLAAEELGLSGKWTNVKAAPEHNKFQYIASWVS